MLGQNQTEIHQFDVCGRVYYSGDRYDSTKGEIVAETVEATTHDEAEAIFRKKLVDHAREFGLTMNGVDVITTIDITIAASGSDEPYIVIH